MVDDLQAVTKTLEETKEGLLTVICFSPVTPVFSSPQKETFD